MGRSEDNLIDFFKTTPNHRMERKKLHPAEEILWVTFCEVIASCNGWDDFRVIWQNKTS